MQHCGSGGNTHENESPRGARRDNLCARRAGQSRRLSQPLDDHDHPVRRRRADRRARAPGRRPHERNPAPKRHRREYQRRRRPDRLAARRQCDGRRLRIRARHRRHPCARPDAVSAPALQRGDRFHAGDPDRQCSAGAGGAQGFAGRQFQGIRRLHQGEPGEDAIRLGRHRLGDASGLPADELPA